jgi:hypothetical protein
VAGEDELGLVEAVARTPARLQAMVAAQPKTCAGGKWVRDNGAK